MDDAERFFREHIQVIVVSIPPRVDDPEPYCNHDDAAVVDGVCECGERISR